MEVIKMRGKVVHGSYHKIPLRILNYVREYFHVLKWGKNRLEFSDNMRIMFTITIITCLLIQLALLPFEEWSDNGMIIKSNYDRYVRLPVLENRHIGCLLLIKSTAHLHCIALYTTVLFLHAIAIKKPIKLN